jgi:hypothetical protein
MMLPSGKYSIDLLNRQITWLVGQAGMSHSFLGSLPMQWNNGPETGPGAHKSDNARVAGAMTPKQTGNQGLGPAVLQRVQNSSPGPIEFAQGMKYSN